MTEIRPPHLGWALVLVGFLVGMSALGLAYAIGRYGGRKEAEALRQLADTLSTKIYYCPAPSDTAR